MSDLDPPVASPGLQEIVLTCDTVVHTAGYRLYVPDSTVTIVDTKKLAELLEKLSESEVVAMQKKYIEQLRGRIEKLGQDLSHQSNLISDLDVQCKFWRQAAEHAVKGWNALEDKVEAALEAVDAIEGNVGAVRELLGSADAPPVETLEHMLSTLPDVDLGYGAKLRVVEEEKPVCPSSECQIRRACTGHAGCAGQHKGE